MNFAQQQRDPRRHLVGFTSVVLLHAIVIYGLANGLGRKVVEVLKKPLDVSIIEEVKTPPPPPPPPKAIPLPKVAPPPPAFVPQVEVQIQQPVQPPVIAAPVQEPPPAPPPVVVAEPRIVKVGAVCPNHISVLSRVQPPPQAQGVSGRVVVEFVVNASGAVGNVKVVKSTNKIFEAVATAAVAQLHCEGQGQNVRVQVPFVFEQER